MKHYVETPFFPAVHNTTVHHPRCRKNGLKTCGKLPVVITPMYSFVPSGAGMSGFGKNTIGMTLTVSVIRLMKTSCVLLSSLCWRPHRIVFFNELDGFRIGFHHRPIEPISHAAFYVGDRLPCFDNPQVRQTAFEFNRHLAERYKDHPALWFFNAWNEPRSCPLGECHCSHSVISYRKWLTERFGSIEALNDAYGKTWSSFDTVQHLSHPGMPYP